MRHSPAQPPARWTPHRQLIFLLTLERTGSPAEAAGAAGMSRESAYRYCKRNPGCLFDLAWRHLTSRMVPASHSNPFVDVTRSRLEEGHARWPRRSPTPRPL